MESLRWTTLHLAVCAAVLPTLGARGAEAEQFYRLHRGVTAYVNNPEGKGFTVTVDVRDVNLYEAGPREVLLKVYGPDGKVLVRRVVPDDGVTTPNYPDRVGGWDHELAHFANLHAKGARPTIRWGAWSDPARLNSIVKRTFEHRIAGGGKGVYRIVLAGTPDHYVTLKLDPALKYGVAGHPTFLHGHGDLLKRSYIYVPKDTSGIFFAIAEPDEPRTRRFTLTGPDGKVLFDGMADGSYVRPAIAFPKGGEYHGKLLRLDVSDGAGDYLVKVTLQQPRKGPFADYVGMGSQAVHAPDEATAMAIRGGTQVVDGLVFWHPFQVRFHEWLKAHPLDSSHQERALRSQLGTIFNGMRLFEVSDGRGSASWTNWATAAAA